MAFSVKIPVRFADVDAMQHVNNATYATWMETARTEYYRTLTGFERLTDVDFIVAKLEVEYLRGARYPELVEVYVWPTHVGNTSFVLGYRLQVDEETIAKGTTVQVAYDYAAATKKPVEAGLRSRLEADLDPPP